MTPQYQDLVRFQVPEKFRGRNKLVVQLWWIVQATLFGLSPQFMYGYRRLILRIFGAKIGHGVLVRATARVTYPWFLEIGDHSWIGDDTVIYNLAPVHIGAHVALAHGVYLCTGLHHIDRIGFDIDAKSIRIEDEAWLANDCFISPGVSIGRGTVIGARSTVLQNMPAGMVCVGYPCKPIKIRQIAQEQRS